MRVRCSACVGSSPRSRGTHEQQDGLLLLGRFIPALAGNTGAGSFARVGPTVHPRARGEHATSRPASACVCGSSPRSRGTQTDQAIQPVIGRFIPALAGNSVLHRPVLTLWSVHPRARGEHSVKYHPAGKRLGSSPRSRGTPDIQRLGLHRARFIPALAGNTSATRRPQACAAVHPRARGEHLGRLGCQLGPGGSSPRSRGTPGQLPEGRPGQRFIPALAGNTQEHGQDPQGEAVHPRARGEHGAVPMMPMTADGSSPRSRGTLLRTLS